MTFRDLGKPIGAHSSDKLETFKSKYFEIVNKQSIGYGGQYLGVNYPQDGKTDVGSNSDI